MYLKFMSQIFDKITAGLIKFPPDIQYLFYTVNDKYVVFSQQNFEKILQHKCFGLDKTTLFVFGGYRQQLNCKHINEIIKNYMKTEAYNVIECEYQLISKPVASYVQAVTNIPTIGKSVAKDIDKLIDFGIHPDRIEFVGHSLGAHMAGSIGRHTKSKVSKIIGLDPAGPLFDQGLAISLKSGDAQYVVEVITDAGIYGTNSPKGDINFFPNFGRRIQPGCPSHYVPFSGTNSEFCSHTRSCVYWAEAIQSKSFIGVQLDRNNNQKDIAILEPSLKDKTGNYYFRTAKKPPYGLGTVGMNCLEK